MKCPRCKSTNIITGNKGFGFGKATLGALLLGPLGLLAGGMGSKRTKCTCTDCGHRWDLERHIQTLDRKAKHIEFRHRMEVQRQHNIDKWKKIGKFLWP